MKHTKLNLSYMSQGKNKKNYLRNRLVCRRFTIKHGLDRQTTENAGLICKGDLFITKYLMAFKYKNFCIQNYYTFQIKTDYVDQYNVCTYIIWMYLLLKPSWINIFLLLHFILFLLDDELLNQYNKVNKHNFFKVNY